MRLSGLFSCVLLWGISISLAQPGVNQATFETIESRARSIYGTLARLHDVVNIDSSVSVGLIEDQNGLLQHSYVFVGKINNRGFAGVYKDGNIIWHSDTTVNAELADGSVFATRDLLHDGKTEILITWTEGETRGGPSALYILKWDGTSANLISSIDSLNVSTIISYPGLFDFADVEGDGVWEIQGEWPVDSLVTYSWNGQSYGKWPNTPQPDSLQYLPRDRLQGTTSVTVSSTQSGFRYQYHIANGSSSIQSIQDIIIGCAGDSVGIVSSRTNWWGVKSDSIIHWANVSYPRLSDLLPNQSDSNFVVQSSGLPSIVPFYLRGRNRTMTAVVDGEVWWSNVLSNSVKSYTVGPVAPLPSIHVITFVDTLESFITRSHSLGWIPSQSVSDKYLGYFTRIMNDFTQFHPKRAIPRIDTVLQQVTADFPSNLTSEGYALLRYNSEFLKTQTESASPVKAGIFNPNGPSISLRAKPSATFSSNDTLRCIELTIRWPTIYNVTLGAVTSSYGFAKDGAVTNVGSYSYQKFRTTTSQALNWASGTEYELFTVPITSPSGCETYRLTNALSGGEWFVDINYLDKTDSTFYQDTANGFAYQNKSASNNATWYSGSRHAAMTSSKLHEVYSSGGEIVYRRKNLSGSWEVTQRLSPGNGATSSHTDPCIQIAHDGSIHVVWQRFLSGTSYSLWYTRSTDGGSTWATADSLHVLGTVGSTSSQGGPKPVITEHATSQIVIVWQTYSSLGALKYIVSTNLGQSWGSIQQITSVPSNTSWDPSIASYPVTNKLLLGYTPPMSSHVYSSVYSGTSWGSPSNVSSGVGLNTNKYPSVAFDVDQSHFYAAWCGQPLNHTEYVIAFRVGNTGGTWGSPFAQFAIDSTGVSAYYPSITGWAAGDDAIDIIYHTSNGKVKLLQSSSAWGGSWNNPRLLSSNGQWANTTLLDQRSPNGSGYPIRCWTDGSSSPYQVSLQSDGGYQLQMAQQQQALPTYHRRVVIESESKGAVIWFDLAPIKVVTSAGDSVVLPFTKLDPRKPFDATLTNAWDYLGTDALSLPSNARSLVIDVDVTSFAHTNDWGANYTNIFTSSTYEIDGITGGKSSALLANQQGVPGRKVIDISSQAGKTVKLRLLASVPATSKETVAVGVGDVYVNP